MTEFSDTSASRAVLNNDDTNPELAAMQLFSDTALRAAVEPSLSPAEQWRAPITSMQQRVNVN